MPPPPVPSRERKYKENDYSRDPTFSRASRDENSSFLTSPVNESLFPMIRQPIPTPRNNLYKNLSRTVYENLNENVDEKNIEDEDYFFGRNMQTEMNEKFDAGRDGSFCVRESTKMSGTYVLDIKKNGKKKSITILNFENKYYFLDNTQFSSIPELIKYYQNNSLKEVGMDQKLVYPLSRNITETVDGLFYKIDGDTKEILTNFSALIDDYNSCLKESERINDEIDLYKDRLLRQQQLKSACQTTINWLDKTIQICNNYDLPERDRKVLNDNIIRQETVRDEIIKKVEQTMGEIEKIKNDLDSLSEQNLENDKKLNILRHRQELFEENLRQKGVSQYLINSIRENGYKEIEEWELYNSYLNREQWYFPTYNSEHAKEVLRNCVSGTFLIRNTSHGIGLGLSVKVKDAVLKCIIYKTANGYGFSEPYDHFQSLEDFVLYYARNNLSFHNHDLDTVLKYPYKYYVNNRDEILEKEIFDK